MKNPPETFRLVTLTGSLSLAIASSAADKLQGSTDPETRVQVILQLAQDGKLAVQGYDGREITIAQRYNKVDSGGNSSGGSGSNSSSSSSSSSTKSGK